MLVAGKWRIDLAEPHQVYRNAAGKRVPGVTTVNGIFAKPHLLRWYAEQEREGVLAALWKLRPDFSGFFDWTDREDEAAELAEERYRKAVLAAIGEGYFAERKRDKAATVGTVTHARIEAFVKGPYDLDPHGIAPNVFTASVPGYWRFRRTWEAEKLRLVASEFQMVSERWQVGGTADIIAEDEDGRLHLRDIKTTKASRHWPYRDVFSQVAAYAEMYEEVEGRRIDVITVDRVGTSGDDEGQSYRLRETERRAGVKRFEAALMAYEADKELGR